MVAYAIAIDVEIFDQSEFARYRAPAMASVEQYGGRLIAHSDKAELLDGEPDPKEVVMAEFPSMEAARRWYHSKEYQAVLPIRLASARGPRVSDRWFELKCLNRLARVCGQDEEGGTADER